MRGDRHVRLACLSKGSYISDYKSSITPQMLTHKLRTPPFRANSEAKLEILSQLAKETEFFQPF